MNVRNEVRRHGRTRLVALAAAGGVLAAGAGLLVPGAAQAAGAVDVVTYQYVGFWAQTWTVPAGVYSATFVLAGAQGGAGGDSSGGTGGPGGRGGELEAVLPVVPGQSYDLQVGDAGAPPGRFTAYGGWPGGGNGDQGGGGGGETTVGLTGGDPASPLLVAGGGGGGSEATTSTPGGPGFPGGAGGGLADATAGGGVTPGAGGSGGGPGTGDAGGAAGMGADATNSGTPGAQGTGGAGQGAAGAGGGGWYGGGSGGTNASPHTPAGAGGGGSGHAASLATDVVSHPGANYGDGWVQIRYTAPAPPVIYGTPPAGQVDQPYSFAFTSFGSPTPTFAVTGGSLPNGLTLSSDGRITGTPTWQGDYSFAVTATNGVDPADTENYTLTVTGVAPSISGTPPSGTVGAPYSFAYTLAGDPAPWAYVDTTGQPLPPGLSLSDDGHLTGTPTTAGTYTFTVVADNDYGNPATTQSTVTIAPAGPSTSAPTISGAPPWAGVGEPFAFVFRTTGTPTPTVTKSAGALPPGLSLSSAGRLSGTPTTAGTYRFTVSAANGTGSPATDAVTMKVLPLPSVSIADASTAEGNSGTHPLTFRVTLSRTSSVPVTVHWATANGTATAGSDYVAGSGTVTFAPGTTSATVSVTVNGDRTKEATETFAVKLTSPSKAVIGDGSGTGTITNDD